MLHRASYKAMSLIEMPLNWISDVVSCMQPGLQHQACMLAAPVLPGALTEGCCEPLALSALLTLKHAANHQSAFPPGLIAMLALRARQ